MTTISDIELSDVAIEPRAESYGSKALFRRTVFEGEKIFEFTPGRAQREMSESMLREFRPQRKFSPSRVVTIVRTKRPTLTFVPAFEEELRPVVDLIGLILSGEVLIRDGKIDTGLDVIFKAIRERVLSENLLEIDWVLRVLPAEILSTDGILGLLTSTMPARSRLTNRAAFFKRAERVIKARGELEEGLLTGLES